MNIVDYITEINGNQVEIESYEILDDSRYNWKEKKVATMRLARIYQVADMPDYATKSAACSTWLKYGVSEDGRRDLQAVNFCQLRLCPMCIGRRAKKAAYKLSQVLNLVESRNMVKYIFLTLTIKNVEGPELGKSLGQLTKGWERLLDQRQVERSVKGWYRAIEITRGNGRNKADRGYHPHIHAILAVEPGYFEMSELYMSQKKWRECWKRALRIDYDPRVWIEATRAKGEIRASLASTLEAAKYVVKDSDYIDPKLTDAKAADIVRDYTLALRRRRLTAYGGWLREAARELNAESVEDDGDLVHIDEDAIRDDVAELIEVYRWNLGVGDYILSDRYINPLKKDIKV